MDATPRNLHRRCLYTSHVILRCVRLKLQLQQSYRDVIFSTVILSPLRSNGAQTQFIIHTPLKVNVYIRAIWQWMRKSRKGNQTLFSSCLRECLLFLLLAKSIAVPRTQSYPSRARGPRRDFTVVQPLKPLLSGQAHSIPVQGTAIT